MRYYVKYTVDYYYMNELAISAYQYGYSYPVKTAAEALRDQNAIRAHFMNHDVYAILKCDEDGLCTDHLQYGAWSTVIRCSEKEAREIEAHIKEEEEIY